MNLLVMKRFVFALLCSTFVHAASGAGQETTQAIAKDAGLDFRWTGNAGFEVVLPTGDHVLVDPWLDSAPYNKLTLDKVTRADYILITHIHGDHADDVKKIQEKFPKVRIFVGALSAEPLTKWQNLNIAKLYKVIDRQEFEFDELKIQAFAGRHTESTFGNYCHWDEQGEMTHQSWGTMDLFHYLITAKDGTRFMVWAGTPSVDTAYQLRGLKPDLAAVHISPKQDFKILSRIMNSMEVGVMMPHHYDAWPTILRKMPAEIGNFPTEVQPLTPENVIEKMMAYVRKTLSDAGTKASFFTPEPHKWYHFDRATRKVSPTGAPA